MPHATICARCGGRRPTPPSPAPYLNPAERLALENGWTLDDFRGAQLQLASASPVARSAVSRDTGGSIPAAPDQHTLIRRLVAGGR